MPAFTSQFEGCRFFLVVQRQQKSVKNHSFAGALSDRQKTRCCYVERRGAACLMFLMFQKRFLQGFWEVKKTKAVNDVSFKVEKGSIFGLVGGSGSGKTTLSRIIMGLLYPDAGSVELDGRNLLLLSRKEWKTVRKRYSDGSSKSAKNI